MAFNNNNKTSRLPSFSCGVVRVLSSYGRAVNKSFTSKVHVVLRTVYTVLLKGLVIWKS